MPRPTNPTRLPSARSVSRLRSAWSGLAFAAAVLLAARSPRADVTVDAGAAAATPLAAHRALVVAHVGPRAVTAGDIEEKLSRVPRYQLRVFGRTGPEIARTFFDKEILRDVLLSLEATDRHLDQDVAVEQGIDRTLSGATLRALLNQVGTVNGITPEEEQQYYAANQARFDPKPRLNIWRILCGTQDEAQQVIAEAKKDGTVPTFTKLARDHSLDKATSLRGGNLGFIGENGLSNEPGILVTSSVLRAAMAVKDGEIVGTPVQEGTSFAVVWRRGTQQGIHRSEETVKAQIADALLKQKRADAQKALLDRLRAEKVSAVDESLLGTFDVSIDDGTVGPRKGRGGAGR